MEKLIHNDYRQQPVTSDEEYRQYCQYLGRLEALIENQEDVVLQARASMDGPQLAGARTSLWRLLTKRQGVVDILAAYDKNKQTAQKS